MAQMSTGGFITLPGGYGTFEEVLEMITWNQVSSSDRGSCQGGDRPLTCLSLASTKSL